VCSQLKIHAAPQHTITGWSQSTVATLGPDGCAKAEEVDNALGGSARTTPLPANTFLPVAGNKVGARQMANQQSSKRARARKEGGVEAASYRIKGPKDFLQLEGVTDILQKILQTAGWGGELTSVALSGTG